MRHKPYSEGVSVRRRPLGLTGSVLDPGNISGTNHTLLGAPALEGFRETRMFWIGLFVLTLMQRLGGASLLFYPVLPSLGSVGWQSIPLAFFEREFCYGRSLWLLPAFRSRTGIRLKRAIAKGYHCKRPIESSKAKAKPSSRLGFRLYIYCVPQGKETQRKTQRYLPP